MTVTERRKWVFDVTGMTCSGCERHVTAALQALPGVRDIHVSYADETAALSADANTRVADVERVLRDAGYPGTVRDPVHPHLGTPRNGGSTDYDLIVVGGGSAGFAAALRADEKGARVALVNAGTLGGTCVNVGCVPSKTLIRAAEANHRRRTHGFNGIPNADGRVDWSEIRQQKDDLVSELRSAKYWDVLSAHESITLFESGARIAGDGTVMLDIGNSIRGQKLVVATGSSPWTADVPGLTESGPLDSTSAMNLDVLPGSMVVIGAGFVGMELGQVFARLGTKVTILSRRNTVLPHEDPEIGPALASYVAAEGIEVKTDVTIQRVERNGDFTVHYEIAGRQDVIVANQVLNATGRRANTSGFGLIEAGVQLGRRGEVLVDDHLRTANPVIYAAGDVTGNPMYVYVAAYAGTVAADNAIGGDKRAYDLTAVPRVTFTDPAVAAVGYMETEAREKGFDPIVSVLPLEHVPRSIAARDTRGFVKLIADNKSRRILGAHILAAEAGEMIMEPALAIRFGLTIEDITSAFHPYLTLSEGIKLAAQTFDKDVAELSCCAA